MLNQALLVTLLMTSPQALCADLTNDLLERYLPERTFPLIVCGRAETFIDEGQEYQRGDMLTVYEKDASGKHPAAYNNWGLGAGQWDMQVEQVQSHPETLSFVGVQNDEAKTKVSFQVHLTGKSKLYRTGTSKVLHSPELKCRSRIPAL